MINPYIPCAECHGYGHTYASCDPYAQCITCEQCAGSGNAWCEECGLEYATETWREGREYTLCDACWREYAEAAAA